MCSFVTVRVEIDKAEVYTIIEQTGAVSLSYLLEMQKAISFNQIRTKSEL